MFDLFRQIGEADRFADGVKRFQSPILGEQAPDLAAAMAQLTPNQRTVLVLRHVVGMDGNEIADVVGGNRLAVYAAARRAERRLRALLESPEQGGG